MKKRTIAIFTALAVFLPLLAGCQDDKQLEQAALDSETNVLTVDGVRYLWDESLITLWSGSNQWAYTMGRHKQIASVEKDGKRYLIDAGEEDPRFLLGHYDQYYFSAIPYDLWFHEDLLEELSEPLTVEKLSCDKLSEEQFEQLLALHSEEEMSDAISEDDIQTEIRTFDVEGFRAWRSIELPHMEIDWLLFEFKFYFSVRTGTPYLECRDGLLRPCPQELTDALELSPELPVIRTMTEDDPRLTLWLDEIWDKYFAEDGISPYALQSACREKQLMRDLEFRVDVYSPEDDGWPLYFFKGYFHPQTGIPYLMFRDNRLREMSQETADSLGLSDALQ